MTCNVHAATQAHSNSTSRLSHSLLFLKVLMFWEERMISNPFAYSLSRVPFAEAWILSYGWSVTATCPTTGWVAVSWLVMERSAPWSKPSLLLLLSDDEDVPSYLPPSRASEAGFGAPTPWAGGRGMWYLHFGVLALGGCWRGRSMLLPDPGSRAKWRHFGGPSQFPRYRPSHLRLSRPGPWNDWRCPPLVAPVEGGLGKTRSLNNRQSGNYCCVKMLNITVSALYSLAGLTTSDLHC